MTDAPVPLAEQETERIFTLKVNPARLWKTIEQMRGNCSPLGERLASVLLANWELKETVRVLDTYGIKIKLKEPNK